MMNFLRSITLLTAMVYAAIDIADGKEKKDSGSGAKTTESKNNLVFYLIEQVYALKSRVQHLEKGENDTKYTLTSHEQRIKSNENRKETRCESGNVGQVRLKPVASWPYSRRINFRVPFQGTPTLTYGLYFLDSNKSANLRVHASVTNVSRTGFQLTLR